MNLIGSSTATSISLLGIYETNLCVFIIGNHNFDREIIRSLLLLIESVRA